MLSTLLIKKGEDYIVDTYEDYGYATGEIEFPAVTEIKDFASRNVPGEDGERVFFPEQSRLEPYDISVEFYSEGLVEPNRALYEYFRDFLTGRDGKGTELSIYSPWHRTGRQKVYCKKIENGLYRREGERVYRKFSVTFRVTDPVTNVLLSKG